MTGHGERRAAAAQVFVADVGLPEPVDADVHHLRRVLRLRPGERVCVSDGAGRWRWCRFGVDGSFELDGDVEVEPRPAPTLTVAFAPVKGERPEWVVQKLTELGIDRIIPVVTARSVVRWEGTRAATVHERLARVAREAAAQSRQVHLPDVAPPCTWTELLAAEGPVLVAEPGGAPPAASRAPVVVGPEGGFTPDELAVAAGRVGLPGGILRAETAAVALGVLLSAARDNLPDI